MILIDLENPRKIKYAIIALMFSISACIIFFALNENINKAETKFQNLAQRLQTSIKNEIQNNAKVISMVKFGLSNNPEFNRSDFRLNSKIHLSYMKGLHAIAWVPKITKSHIKKIESLAKKDGFPKFKVSKAEKNKPFSKISIDKNLLFPIFYLEPYVNNELALGYNISSNRNIESILKASARTGKMLASSLIQLPGSQDENKFMLIMPIFNRESQSYRPPSIKRLKGFVVTIHNAQEIIHGAINQFDTNGVTINIIDLIAPLGHRSVYSLNKNIARSTLKELKSSENITLGGRKWKIEIISNSIFWSNIEWLGTILLIIFGCLFTFSVAILINYLLSVSAHTKELIIEKTAEYKEAKQLAEHTKQQAEDALASRSQFIANMSHEIRTPLNGILGYADLLFEEEDQSEKKKRLEIIKKSGEGLLCIINDILDLSKIESGKLSFKDEVIYLSEFLTHIIDMHLDLAEQNESTLRLTIEDEVHKYYLGDPNRLRQILINLIGNAIKFTHQGSVVLKVTYSKDGLFFHIIDSGIGMKDDDLNKIFENFTQADNSKSTKFGGTGLGLSIVRSLVEQWNGKIDVSSAPGKGTTFSVFLPMQKTDYKEKRREEFKSKALIPNINLSNIKILVCEDNEVNISLIEARLKKSGFEVMIARNGLEGFENFKKNNFNIILMDIRMPEMDGVTATKKIRQYEKDNNLDKTPIVAQTANVMKEDVQLYIEAGMDEHISKPITYKKLNGVINKLCGTST